MTRFSIDVAVKKLREAVRPFKKAMLFELADEGYRTPFEQLVACLISIRTRDEVSLLIARKFFKAAPTPRKVMEMRLEELAALLRGSQFPFQKAENLQRIARDVVEKYSGVLPCDEKTLLSFKGVGPKCANLVLGIACGQKKIGVDIHVHRVTNRWGYVKTKTPEETLAMLEKILPRAYWVEINALLVPFGKHVCTGVRPHCPDCPLLPMCGQVGVTAVTPPQKSQTSRRSGPRAEFQRHGI